MLPDVTSRIWEADPEFSRGGAPIYYFAKSLPKTAWKRKNLDRSRARARRHLGPSLVRPEACWIVLQVTRILLDVTVSHYSGNPRYIWSSLMRLYVSKLRAKLKHASTFLPCVIFGGRKVLRLFTSDVRWDYSALVNRCLHQLPVRRGWSDLWQITDESNIST